MTEVAAQISRADNFVAELRAMIAATVTDSDSPCAEKHRSGIRRIAATLDAVPYVTMCNLANLNTAMGGGVLELTEVCLMCVGAGPTLDYADATAFLAEFQPMIDMAMRRYTEGGGYGGSYAGESAKPGLSGAAAIDTSPAEVCRIRDRPRRGRQRHDLQ